MLVRLVPFILIGFPVLVGMAAKEGAIPVLFLSIPFMVITLMSAWKIASSSNRDSDFIEFIKHESTYSLSLKIDDASLELNNLSGDVFLIIPKWRVLRVKTTQWRSFQAHSFTEADFSSLAIWLKEQTGQSPRPTEKA